MSESTAATTSLASESAPAPDRSDLGDASNLWLWIVLAVSIGSIIGFASLAWGIMKYKEKKCERAKQQQGRMSGAKLVKMGSGTGVHVSAEDSAFSFKLADLELGLQGDRSSAGSDVYPPSYDGHR